MTGILVFRLIIKDIVRQMSDRKSSQTGFAHTFINEQNVEKNASGNDVKFLKDGRTVVSSCLNDSHVKVWDLDGDLTAPKVFNLTDSRLVMFSNFILSKGREFTKNQGISLLAIHSTRDLVAIGSIDGGAYLINVKSEDMVVPRHILRSPKELCYSKFRPVLDVRFGNGLLADRVFVAYEQTHDRKDPGLLRMWGMHSSKIPYAEFSVAGNAASCFALSLDGLKGF